MFTKDPARPSPSQPLRRRGLRGKHTVMRQWCQHEAHRRKLHLVFQDFPSKAEKVKRRQPCPLPSRTAASATVCCPISSFPGPVRPQPPLQLLPSSCGEGSLLRGVAAGSTKVQGAVIQTGRGEPTRPASLRVASTLRLPTGYRHDLFIRHPRRIPRPGLRTFDAAQPTRPRAPPFAKGRTEERITQNRSV